MSINFRFELGKEPDTSSPAGATSDWIKDIKKHQQQVDDYKAAISGENDPPKGKEPPSPA